MGKVTIDNTKMKVGANKLTTKTMEEIGKSVTKMKTKELHLENYNDYYNHSSSPSSLGPLPLNEILRLHGYLMLTKQNRHKAKILEVLSGVDNLLNPHRSTLNETPSSSCPCLTVDEVNADLTALHWHEDFSLESLQTISTTTKSNIVVNEIQGSGNKKRKRMERKGKEVFDAIHPTKPRSKKNCLKRKYISNILDFNRIFASLG